MAWMADFKCDKCGNECEIVFDSYEESQKPVHCAKCKKGIMKRSWNKAPAISSYGKPMSDASIKAVQHECRERFVKKELPDLRHKFGQEIDDSLVGGALGRIEKDEKVS